MTLPSELLEQARTLVTKEPRRPKQASLRRGVSAAYYALFHLLVEDAVQAMFAGSNGAQLRDVVHRAFEHRTMKKAAQGFSSTNLAKPWKPLLPSPSRELNVVARTFVDLQEARHRADYDLSNRLTRSEALDLVERVEDAARAWRSIRKSARQPRAYSREARVFLAALLVHGQVSRR